MWTAGPDKLCDYFNKPWLEFTGRRIEQELGDGWAAGVHEADRDRCLEIYNSGFDARQPFVMEYRLRRRDGEYRWMLDSAVPRWSGNGKFLGFIGSCIDIHERKATEARLRESEERYRVTTETASDGIITIDEQSTIVFANPAVARIFGYEVGEIVGQPLAMLMPEHLRQAHRSSLSRYVGTGEKHLSWDRVEMPGLHKNGQEFALELSFAEHTGGSTRLFTGVLRDITGRRRLEEQLRHTAKLESLGVLAGGVAHDFNNLLTGVLGHTSLVLDSLPPHDPNRASLREVLLAGEHAANLARQLLAYAGKGRFVLEAINISALIREISALAQASIPKRVHLRLDLRNDLLPITADRGQIQQIIMNLILNGAEAISDDQTGTVLVTTSMREVDETYMRLNFTGEELTPGTYVCMEVHDSGIGMDQATMAKIFDPFFTTKVMGRGLGLSAVLGIVRGHKGALRIYSTPGQGTTFKVLFPAASQAAVQHIHALPANLRGSGKVLVVDDEAAVRRTAQAALERYGYTVLLAENGLDAMSAVGEHVDLRLILLDLSMPHMDGIETLRRVMALNPNLRVVLSSGYSEMEVTQRFAGKGLAGFIQKPYTATALAEVVQRILQSPAVTPP
jgi:PAS domain S-box-containing protein